MASVCASVFCSDSVQTSVEPPAAWEEDQRLVAAVLEGDMQAYGTLVQKYQDRLCSALRRRCGSDSDVQDAVQDAFLQAYRKLGTYNGASAFYSWLYRIALNAVVNQHRRQQTRINHENARLRQNQSAGPLPSSPAEWVLRREKICLVQSALESLREEYRRILVLREWEDCEYDEIAAALSIPVGTVRSRLHRARAALREQLPQLADFTN